MSYIKVKKICIVFHKDFWLLALEDLHNQKWKCYNRSRLSTNNKIWKYTIFYMTPFYSDLMLQYRNNLALQISRTFHQKHKKILNFCNFIENFNNVILMIRYDMIQ